MKLIFEGAIEQVTTRRDNTIKITIGSQELDADQKAKLFGFSNKHSMILLSDSTITDAEINVIEKPLLIGDAINETTVLKSQSQRLRGALFFLHQRTKSPMDFKDFYEMEMEDIINQINNQNKTL